MTRAATFPAALLMSFAAAGAIAETLALKVERAEAIEDQATGMPVVVVKLQPESAKAFGIFSTAHVGQQIRVRSGETLLSEPFIRDPILGGTIMISGNLTAKSAKDLAIILRAGESELTIEADDKQ